jgi:hypothetical protein
VAKLAFQIQTDQPEDISGRAWRRALVAGWFAVGVYHDETVQPRKFQPGAASRYGYQDRSPKYLERKQRGGAATWRIKDGGRTPLVYSGVTRTRVLSRQLPRAFPTRVWVQIPTPPYIQMRPDRRRWNMPAMGVELTSVTADEIREMEKIFLEAVEAQLNTERDRMRRL